MKSKWHEEVKNLSVGDVLRVDRRWGFPEVVKLFENFGYEYEEIFKTDATWAKSVRRTK